MKLEFDTDKIGITYKKGWGFEQMLITTELYCSKLLCFTKKDNKFSYHFHKDKDETWKVLQGSFVLKIKDTNTGKDYSDYLLKPNDIYRVYPGIIHQLIALEDNAIILETSTEDKFTDNYRIEPGDSQK